MASETDARTIAETESDCGRLRRDKPPPVASRLTLAILSLVAIGGKFPAPFPGLSCGQTTQTVAFPVPVD